MKKFSEEYTDLENRVVEAFTQIREKNPLIEFYKITPETEADDTWQDDLGDCFTTYYNHKHSGEEKHVFVIKIDEEGIHTVDSDDYTKQVCIGINDLNGLYYKIDLLEEINKILNDIN